MTEGQCPAPRRFVGRDRMIARLAVVLVVALGSVAAVPVRVSAVTGRLPDLRTLPPTNLSLTTEVLGDGQTHYRLRFDNTVWNAGPGRLELVGKKRAKIYQRFYNARGALVDRAYIGNDSVFHAGHNHYHIENFASYLLVELGKKGTKTGFCIVDTINHTGQYGPRYTTCGQTLQGLSVGWADVYPAHLADQWIDLGAPLADGTYTLRSTANPRQRLIEANYGNNAAQTCFTAQGGVVASTWAC